MFTTLPHLRDNVCPWCIADGSAAAQFDLMFVYPGPLPKAMAPREIVDEVSKRTPCYLSWQEDRWQTHCNDASVYVGAASKADVANASPATIEARKAEHDLSDDDWRGFTAGYPDRGLSAFYTFVCRHCDMVLLGWDLE